MKKRNKKFPAIFGMILIILSMFSPAIALSFENEFITNGAFDANIVVGSLTSGNGLASDLAGAIDIAAAFAQRAITEPVEAVEGVIPERINSSTGYIGFGDSAILQEYTADWMINKTYDSYELIESLNLIDNGGVTLDNNGEFKIDFGALVYKIKSNSTLFNGMELSFFDNDYRVTEVLPGDKITFGQIETESNKAIPGTVIIPEKATIEMLGIDTISRDVFVRVTSDNGTVLFDDYMSNNGSKTFEGYSFQLSNLRMLTSGSNTIDVDWTAALKTLNHNGNGSVIDSELVDWKVRINSDELSFSSPQYDLDTEAIVLNNGEEFNLMDYFSVKYDGFDNTNTTSLLTKSILNNSFSVSLNYENNESESLSVYLGSYTEKTFGVNGLTDYMMLINGTNAYRFRTFQNDTDRYVEVFNQDTTNLSEPLTTLYNSTDSNITNFAIKGGLYELTWDDNDMNITLKSWNGVNPKYLNGLSFSNGKLSVTELDGKTLQISYNNSDLSVVSDDYTDFGTRVMASSNQISLIIPDERKTSNIWFGRITDGIEGRDSEITPVTPGIGMVDSEVNEITRPTILIGGGNANTLTRDLGLSGEGVSIEESVSMPDKAYIQLIEDAFGSGNTVLVVAGYEAKDTRLACKYLSSLVSEGVDLDSDLTWLNTDVDDYTSVTVVE